jgi:aminodeoxyfutalosine deaminase
MTSSFPKVELHLHFDGTVSPEAALRLADRHAVDLVAIGLADLAATGRYPSRYRDLGQFLEFHRRVDSLVQTDEDVHDIAAALAAGQVAQGVSWTEVIVPIWAYLGRGIPEAALWDALAAGLRPGGEDSRVGVLLEIHPDDPPSTGRVAKAVLEGAGRGLPVVGVGLMGVGPPAVRARLTQATGAHGITLVREAAVLERVIRDGIPLDLCPTSNVAIAGVASLAAHPIGELSRAGAIVTVSTDDPPFVGTTLVDELARAGALLGLDERGQVELQRRTLDVSFAPREIRASVLARLDAADAELAGDAAVSRPAAGT